MEQELLVMKNINKSFPGVHALRDVSLSLQRGEVHALIGENGAGKSTLMKVLSGVHQADSGEILWEGKPVQIHSTTEATAMGISIIYQELNLMPNMSIRENIFLGRENRKARFFVDFQKTSELAKTYTDMVGLTADVNTLVKDLSIAQRQMVEVAKALSTNAKLIVMDEPTSSLTDRETEILMNVIRNLRDQGVAVVFISHRLSELFEISDRITVLRDGECVGTIDTKDCTEPQLVNMMVGRTLDDIYPKGNAQIGEAVLEAKHLNAGKMVQDVSFTLHRGEILGFAGLIGAGRSEVMRAIFGVDPLDSGEIIIDGKKLEKHTPTDAIRRSRPGPRRPEAAWPDPRYVRPGKHHAAVPARGDEGRHPQPQEGKRDHPDLYRAARHQDARCGAEGPEPLRRQPAEGRHRQMAGDPPEGSDPR